MIVRELRIPYPDFPPRVRDDSRTYRVVDVDGKRYFEKRSTRRDRLQNEADILIALSGIAGVPQFHEVNGPDEDERFGLRVEYLRGDILPTISKTMSTILLFRILFQTLRILRNVHGRGVVHGDVRPWNIIFDGERAVLIDFEESVKRNRLPGPIEAYQARKGRRDDVHRVLKEYKDYLSTALFMISVSRSWLARWVKMLSPTIVRKFQLPPPGHGVLRDGR